MPASSASARRVLDSVADGLIEASGDLIVLVAIWLDARADDETAVRLATRTAVAQGDQDVRRGAGPRAAAQLVADRDALRNPFYSGE